MSKGGFASGFAFGYDPTGRSVFFYKNRPFDKEAHDRQNTLFDIHDSTCPQCLETGVKQF
jgi:hypothetical protein